MSGLTRYGYLPFGCGDLVREVAGRHFARVEAIADGFVRVTWLGTRMSSSFPIEDFELVERYADREPIQLARPARLATIVASPRAQLEAFFASRGLT